MSAISFNLSNVAGISQPYSQVQNQHPALVNQQTYFDSAPNTIRPQNTKMSLKCDMFGANALEEDDRKNSLSPGLNK